MSKSVSSARRIAVAIGVCISCSLVTDAQTRGHFVGAVVVRWLEQDGVDRDMELTEPFEYVDPAGKRWVVPKGAVVNGASIPQPLWIFGSPYTGDYRRASVVHDHYCTVRTQPWRQVHRMFLEAAIDGGLADLSARTMYSGIMLGGPRWELMVTKNLEGQTVVTPVPLPMPHSTDAELQDLRQWVERNNPTPSQIDVEVDRRLQLK